MRHGRRLRFSSRTDSLACLPTGINLHSYRALHHLQKCFHTGSDTYRLLSMYLQSAVYLNIITFNLHNKPMGKVLCYYNREAKLLT